MQCLTFQTGICCVVASIKKLFLGYVLENSAIMAHILQWGRAGDPVQFRTLCAVTGPLTEILVNKQQQWMPNKWWLRCWFSQFPSFNRIDRRYATRETLFCTGFVIVKDYFKHIRRNLNGDNADINMCGQWSLDNLGRSLHSLNAFQLKLKLLNNRNSKSLKRYYFVMKYCFLALFSNSVFLAVSCSMKFCTDAGSGPPPLIGLTFQLAVCQQLEIVLFLLLVQRCGTACQAMWHQLRRWRCSRTGSRRILVPELLWNCLTKWHFLFPVILSPTEQWSLQ